MKSKKSHAKAQRCKVAKNKRSCKSKRHEETVNERVSRKGAKKKSKS
jgi:hypothetical protein